MGGNAFHRPPLVRLRDEPFASSYTIGDLDRRHDLSALLRFKDRFVGRDGNFVSGIPLDSQSSGDGQGSGTHVGYA